MAQPQQASSALAFPCGIGWYFIEQCKCEWVTEVGTLVNVQLSYNSKI